MAPRPAGAPGGAVDSTRAVVRVEAVSQAGYSGTPLARKLGIEAGAEVGLVGAPEGFEDLLAPLPEGVRLRRRVGSGLDVICFFVTERRAVERRGAELAGRLVPDGSLWLHWPKRASKVPTDVTEDVL